MTTRRIRRQTLPLNVTPAPVVDRAGADRPYHWWTHDGPSSRATTVKIPRIIGGGAEDA